MQSVSRNPLLKILLFTAKRPELLTGEKSLLALDSFIAGYLMACGDYDFGQDILLWYRSFSDYVTCHFSEAPGTQTVKTMIRAHGYDDKSGVDCFFDLLKAFTEKEQMVCQKVSQLAPDEVRVLRFDKYGMFALAKKEVRGHLEEYFGLKSEGIDGTVTYEFWLALDNTFTCIAHNGKVDHETLKAQVEKIPVCSSMLETLKGGSHHILHEVMDDSCPSQDADGSVF